MTDANQNQVLRRGDYSQFSSTHPSTWTAVTGPKLGDQDSGCVFIAATQPGRGDLLFWGAQRSNVYVGPLDPASASDWVELDPNNLVHVDLHGIFLSPNFAATIQDGRFQVSAGTLWLLSDGGIHASVLGGDFAAVKYLRTLSCVNVAGVAMPSQGPALSLNTGDNDGFYSLNGGRNWQSQDYGGGDNDCAYGDPLTPNVMLVFTPRWDTHGSTLGENPTRGTVTLYKSEVGGLPDATNSAQRHIVPGPPRRSRSVPAWNADSSFALQGSRPIVLTKPGEAPAGDGDYVFIRFKTDQKAVVLRTQSLLDIVSPDDWDTLSEVSTTTAQMQIGTNTTDSAPFVTADGWVYFRGHNDNKLWKVFNDGSGLTWIGGNTTKSTPFVTADGWIYFQGTDDRLLKVFNDGTRGTQIGTNTTDSAPSVTADGWVYFRGHNDNNLWRVFNDGSHLVWLGGNTTASTPFVTGRWMGLFPGYRQHAVEALHSDRSAARVSAGTDAAFF